MSIEGDDEGLLVVGLGFAGRGRVGGREGGRGAGGGWGGVEVVGWWDDEEMDR